MNIKVVLEKAEDGNYFIYVPALPGVLADGRTKEDAIQSLREVLSAYLEPSEEDLPAEGHEVKEIEV